MIVRIVIIYYERWKSLVGKMSGQIILIEGLPPSSLFVNYVVNYHNHHRQNNHQPHRHNHHHHHGDVKVVVKLALWSAANYLMIKRRKVFRPVRCDKGNLKL